MSVSRLIGLVFTLLVGAASLHAQDQPPFGALLNEMLSAANSGDVDRAADFFTETAVIMVHDVPMVRGRAAITAAMSQMRKNGVTKVEATVFDAHASADIGYSAVRWTFHGPRGTTHEKGVTVWKRNRGVWKIAYDVANSDPSLK